MQNFLGQDGRQIVRDEAILSTATYNSPAIDIQSFKGYSVQANITAGGAITGTFKLQCTNDGTNWVDVADSERSITAVGVLMLNVAEAYYDKFRAVYISTSGAITLNLYIQAKG